jgi:hypothetical protein
MKIVSLFSVVRGYNIPIIILAQYPQPFYFGTGEGSIEHFTRFRPHCFRFLFIDCPVTSIISTIVKRLDQPSQQNHVRSIC